MRVRSSAEIARLDEELNLFDEQDWSFFDVLDTKETNFEYFDDSKDLDFTLGKKLSEEFKMLLIAIIILAMLIIVCFSGLFYLQAYNNEPISNEYRFNIENTDISYVSGDDATSEELIEISKVMSGYFNFLNNSKYFSSLDDYCLDKSNFYGNYVEYTDKIHKNYDSADCYARSMSLFGGMLTYEGVDKIVHADNDEYYVYCNIVFPSSLDIEEYCYSLQYTVSKHFSSNKITEQDVLKYLLEAIDVNDISYTKSVWCFNVKRLDDGSFKIVSDSMITDACLNSYTTICDKMIKFLGSSLVNSPR